jgi:hypothetical protein
MPLSRQMELKYRDYFSWPAYWLSTYLDAYGSSTYPRLVAADEAVRAGKRPRQEPALRNASEYDPHLRTAARITGYSVYASDRPRTPAGHVRDFTVQTDGWSIGSIIVGTRHRKVAVSRNAVRDIDWALSLVHLNVPHAGLHAAPQFDEAHV